MSTKKSSNSASAPAVKSFADHLGELRTRLAWVALVFIVASSLAYSVKEQLVSLVLSPIGHQKLVYLTPAGGFAFIFQISMYAGMLATAPVAIYHIYRFVSPALPEYMNRMSLRVVATSSMLLALGVSFGYFVAIPAALQFLTNFGGDFVQANLTADSYLSFVVAYLLGLGLLFQLPLLLVFWNWIQPFKPGGLLGTQRYVLVGAFIAAAMITPTPDAVNQCLIAIPIVAIYQLGVVAVYFMNKRARRRPVHAPVQSRTGAPGALRHDVVEVPVFHAGHVAAASAPKPMPVHVPVATVAAPASNPITSQKQPQPSLDGFSRVRSRSIGVPSRVAYTPPARSVARSRALPSIDARRQTSIDGFGFAS